jgi:NAD(P)-dependent dehydrogenase (short-subunit alcohol dehydrogenase family)
MANNAMQGKVCLVTGATQGIGKATALGLAQQGAEVVIVGRDAAKTEAVAQELKQQSGNENIGTLVADLSVMSEVRKLAQQFRSNHSALHVLVNNAGGVFMERKVTRDGFEYTLGLNHFAYFVLTQELLPLLEQTGHARVVSLSSEAQSAGKINFDDLQLEKNYSGLGAYCQSKLANVMFTYELSRRLASKHATVTANCVHPGGVATGFGKNNRGVFGFLMRTIAPFVLITPEKGADTAVYLASSPEVEGVSGKYFVKRKVKKTNPLSYDEACQRLWELSEKLTAAPA